MRSLVLFFLLLSSYLSGQVARMDYPTNEKNFVKEQKINIWNFGANLGPYFGGADWSKSYGTSFGVGPHVSLKSSSNVTLSLEYNFIFGGKIKDLSNLDSITSKTDGYIIDAKGQFSSLKINQRAHFMKFEAGYLFPKTGKNPNSGIEAKLGIGYLIHYVSFYTAGGLPPQLSNEYVKGYDNRTSGFVFSQSVGYRSYSNKKLINFAAFLEFNEGFTYNTRSWNYAKNERFEKQRLDFLTSIKIYWFIPYYKKDGFNNEFH